MTRPEVKRACVLLFGERALKRDGASRIVEWAMACLDAGVEAPSLHLCAALTEQTRPREAVTLMQQALAEVAIAEPSSGEALGAYADQLAADVLDGRCDAALCVREIYAVAAALDYPRALRRWTFLEDMRADLERGRASYFEPNLTPQTFAEHVRDAAATLLRRDFWNERIWGT